MYAVAALYPYPDNNIIIRGRLFAFLTTMSNYCDNYLTISGLSPDEIELFNDLLAKRSSNTSFLQHFIPAPKEDSDKYKFCLDNWGTTRDVVSDYEYFVACREVHFYFFSTWSPPLAGLRTISSYFPRATFTLYYYETGNDFAGKAVFNNGLYTDLETEYSELTRMWLRNEHPALYESYLEDKEDTLDLVEDLWGDVTHDDLKPYLDNLKQND